MDGTICIKVNDEQAGEAIKMAERIPGAKECGN